MRSLQLYPFRYRDPRTGQWIRARYLAELPEIQRRYAEWELIGPPEIRYVADETRFNHFNRFALRGDAAELLLSMSALGREQMPSP